MAEFFRSNPAALRYSLLYEFLRVKSVEDQGNEASSVFSKYNDLCKVIGDDVMKYSEFEFWFYRFSNGNFDLNYEIDKNKKVYELTDMPMIVIGKVVEYLSFFDRLALAKTSRSLKTFVKDQNLFLQELDFTIHNVFAFTRFDNRLFYIKELGDHSIKSNQMKCIKDYTEKELIRGVPYWKVALIDLKKILKLPKLHLEKFNLHLFFYCQSGERRRGFLDEAIDALEAALKTFPQLLVKHFSITTHSMKRVLNILPSLKPGYLTKIEIDVPKPESYLFEELVKMEQWKQAKQFTSRCSFNGPLHYLYQFEEFDVRMKNFFADDFREMKEILFTSPGFKICSIKFDNSFDESIVREVFGNSIPDDEHIYHYPVPNSNEYFKIHVMDREIKIERMKK